jgi:hypothetical protein
MILGLINMIVETGDNGERNEDKFLRIQVVRVGNRTEKNLKDEKKYRK